MCVFEGTGSLSSHAIVRYTDKFLFLIPNSLAFDLKFVAKEYFIYSFFFYLESFNTNLSDY